MQRLVFIVVILALCAGAGAPALPAAAHLRQSAAPDVATPTAAAPVVQLANSQPLTATDPTSSTLPLRVQQLSNIPLDEASMTAIKPEERLTLADRSLMFFSGYSGAAGRELWRTDGTPAGTFRLTDIGPGSIDSDPDSFHEIDGELWFWAYGGAGSFRELWRSDGTVTGTMRLDAAYAQASLVVENQLAKANQRLFFVGRSTNGLELWVSRGTAAQTYEVLDINPGLGDSSPQNFASTGAYVYFTAFDGTSWGLWRSDGTPEGTVQVQAAMRYDLQTVLNGTVYARGRPEAGGCQLLRIEGTSVSSFALCPDVLLAASDWMVAQAATGPDMAALYVVQPGGPQLVFGSVYWDHVVASVPLWGDHTVYLWGGRAVNLDTGVVRTMPSGWLTVLPTEVYQMYQDPGTSSMNMSRDDGTTVSIRTDVPFQRVEAINGRFVGLADMQDSVEYGRMFLFDDFQAPLIDVDVDPYSLNSSPEGPVQVMLTTPELVLYHQQYVNSGVYAVYTVNGVPVNEQLADVAAARVYGTYLLDGPGTRIVIHTDKGVWVTDGTPAGTSRVLSSTLEFVPAEVVFQAADVMLFQINPYQTGNGLYRVDGTAAGSGLVSADRVVFGRLGAQLLASNGTGSGPLWLYNVAAATWIQLSTTSTTWWEVLSDPAGAYAILASRTGGNITLWYTDGTAAGTAQITANGLRADLTSSIQSTATITQTDLLGLGSSGDTAFLATSVGTQTRLHAVDLNTRTLTTFATLDDLLLNTHTPWTNGAFIVGRRASDTDGQPDLRMYWVDFAAQTTRNVLNVTNTFGVATMQTHSFTNQNTLLVNILFYGGGRCETWLLSPEPAKTGQIGTTCIRTKRQLGERLLIEEHDMQNYYGPLFVADGTLAGGVQLLNPALLHGWLGTVEGPSGAPWMLYGAEDSQHGNELWRTDGTAAGTQMVGDLNPGQASTRLGGSAGPGSTRTYLSQVQAGYRYFIASDGRNGQELWRSNGLAQETKRLTDLNPGPRSSLNELWLWPEQNRLLAASVHEFAHVGDQLFALSIMPDLSLTLSAPVLITESTVALDISVINRSAQTTAPTSVTLILPPGVAVLEGAGPGEPVAGGTAVRLALPSLPPGAQTVWHLRLSLPADSGPLAFSAAISGGYGPISHVMHVATSRVLLPVLLR